MEESGVADLARALSAQWVVVAAALRRLQEAERKVSAPLAVGTHPADFEGDASLEAVYAHCGTVLTGQLHGLAGTIGTLRAREIIRCAGGCGEEITQPRLLIAPGTRRCVDCQERYERRKR